MEYILGALLAMFFFLCLFLASYIGYTQGKKQRKTIPIGDDEKRNMKQLEDHFKAMFNYDVPKALQRKKVK